MKKILVMLGALFALIFAFCSCGGEQEIPDVTITVEYTCTQGGALEGEAIQAKTIKSGGSAKFNMVTAIPSEGYRFAGWSDGHQNRFRVDTLSQSSSFQAIFEKIMIGTITYEAEEGGSIEGELIQSLEYGAVTSRVSAVADYGYHFVGWSDGVTEPARFDVVEGDKTVSAIFSNEVIVEYKTQGGGYIFGSTTQRVKFGQSSQSVMAVPNAGCRFVGWSDGYKIKNRTDTITENVVYTAIFINYYTISASVYNGEWGYLEGTTTQTVDDGVAIETIKAVPREGYSFICWSNGSSNPELTGTISENMELEAYFGHKSYGMPVISIDTEDGLDISSKTEYKGCVITVNDTVTQNHVLWADAQIKGRGNSTWNMEKKPYKIKFNMKQDLFGYGGAKDWVLLNNHIDKSLMRNFLAYRLAGAMSDLECAPDCELVEVYLNGRYDGVYLLCEQVEVNEHRVEVEKDPISADTGYLVEMDGWSDVVQVYVPDSLNKDRRYTIKSPDSDIINADQKGFIESYLKECIRVLSEGSYTEASSLIDIESFAQAYIIFELFKNPDVDYSSFYMYKEANGKLFFGPVWDFDMCMGNAKHKGGNVKKYDYLWARNTNPWFNGLLGFKEFEQRVAELLDEYEPIFEQELTRYYKEAYENRGAYEQNFVRWKVMNICVSFEPPEIVALGSWEKNVEWTKTYLKNSFDFLQGVYVAEEAQN